MRRGWRIIGVSGAFLSCMGEKVNTYRPVEGRQWNVSVTQTVEAESPVAAPDSPSSSTPAPGSGNADYFGAPNGSGSVPNSPVPTEFPSNDGGKVRKGKRGSSSAGGLTKPSSQKGRRRPTSAGSAGGSVTSSRRGSSSDSSASSGALWQVDIGETSVWTIVGVGE